MSYWQQREITNRLQADRRERQGRAEEAAQFHAAMEVLGAYAVATLFDQPQMPTQYRIDEFDD